MKNLLFLFLTLISFSAFSQTTPKINLRSGSAVTISDARLRAQLNFYLPHTHGLTLNGGLDSLGAIFYDDSSHSIWFIDTSISGGHIYKQVGDAQLKDSIVVNALNQYPILHNPFRANPTDTIYFFGDSYTVGNGATNGYGWTTWFAYRMGAVEANYGINGSTLEKRSPVDWLGTTNMIDRLSTVPTKTFNRKMLVFAFGLNDIGQNGANYNTTNYKADYDSVMHYCINKGWQPWEILIIPPYWIGQAGYAAYAALSGNAAPTVQRHRDFVFAAQETATKWGTLYFDIFTDQLRNDTTLISGDNIHPNDAGYKFIEWDISKYIGANERILLGTKSDGVMANPTMINLGAGYGGSSPDPSKLRVCWYCDGTPNDNFGVGIFSQNLTFYAGGASTNIQWRINNSNPLMTLNTSGLLLDQNTSNLGSATPHYLNLGSSYNNTKFGDSVNLKLGIYQLNSGTGAGFSLASDGSTNSFEYISPWNVNHDWWVGPTKRMTLSTSGNLLLGTSSDNGYKLNVNGDIKTVNIVASGYKSTFTGFSPKLTSQILPPSKVPDSFYVSNQYTGFGFIDMFNNGVLVQCFIQSNNHVGGDSHIRMRRSYDQGRTWETKTIDSGGVNYVVGGLSGGVTNTNRLIVFIQRLDRTTLAAIDQRIMYSDDEGDTWSPETIVSNNGHPFFQPYGPLCKIGGSKTGADSLLLSWYGYGTLGTDPASVYIIKSGDDGVTWTSPITVFSNVVSQRTESSFSYLGGGVIIGLMRSEVDSLYGQTISFDNGNTWTYQGSVSFGIKGTPAWTKVFRTQNDKRAVAAYHRNGTNINVVYGLADSLILGPSKWNTSDIPTIATDVQGSGYIQVVHPYEQMAGIGTYYDETYPQLYATIKYVVVPVGDKIPIGSATTISGLTPGRIPIANSSSSFIDYNTLKYNNSSKAIVIDNISGSTWNGVNGGVIDGGRGSITMSQDGSLTLLENAYLNTNYKYYSNASAGLLAMTQGRLHFYNGPSGVAGDDISLSERFSIRANGEMYINNSVGVDGQILMTHGAGSGPTWSNYLPSQWDDVSGGINFSSTRGFVGIHNTTPIAPLHISPSTSGNTATMIVSDNNSSIGASFALGYRGMTSPLKQYFGWVIDNNGLNFVRYLSNTPASPQTAMLMTHNDNFVIGSLTDNGKKLQVNGDMYTSGNLWFSNNTAVVGANQGTSTISLYDGAQYALTLGSGKAGFGINNYSPSATVDILGAGTTSSTSSLLVRNSTPSNILQLKDNGAFSLPKYGLGNFTGTGAYRLGVNSSGDLIELGTNFNGLTETNGLTKLGGTITETTTLTGSATDKRITISSYAGIGNAVLEIINNNSGAGSQFGYAFKASSVTNAPAIYGVSGSGNGVIGGSTSGAGVYGGSSIGTGVTAYISDTLGTPLYIDHRPTNTGSGNKVYNSMMILRESGGPTVSSGIGSRIAWIMAGRDGSGNPSGQYPTIGGIEVKENIIGGPTMQSQMSLIAQGDSTTRTIGIFHGSGYVKYPFYGLGNITGTPAYNLAVDNTGKIIEVAASSGGLTSVNSQTGPAITLQGTQGSNVSTTSSNTLSISSPYILEFVDTTFSTVSNSALGTTISTDGGIGIQGVESTNLTAGSIVRLSGFGTITTAATAGIPTFRFDLGIYNIQVPLNSLGNSQSYEYEYLVTFLIYEIGTSKKATVEVKIDLTNSSGNVTRYPAHATTTLSNTGTPAATVSVGWNTASPDNSVISRNNIFEVLRK